MVRIKHNIFSKYLFIILMVSFFDYGLFAQNKHSLEQLNVEYLQILDQNSNLKYDTMDLVSLLAQIKVENQNLKQLIHQDSIHTKRIEDNRAKLFLNESFLNDSLARLKQEYTSIRDEIESDSLLFVELTFTNMKIAEFNLDYSKLSSVQKDLENQLIALGNKLAALKNYSKDVEVLKKEKATIEGRVKDIDTQINKTNMDLKFFNEKLASLSDERMVFSYFNKQKIESIKSQKNLKFSQVNCSSENKVQIENYLKDIKQLLYTGVSDSELYDMYNLIINYEAVCQWITESEMALYQKYDKNGVEKLLSKTQEQTSLPPNVHNIIDILKKYCEKSELAYAYIEEASNKDNKAMKSYLDFVLEQFNNYPYLKSELQKYRNTQTHSLEQLSCN